jgi:two-component system LytT family response regulator
MPGGTGFDLLARLDQAPLVIFTTAYDHHAVRAFEVNALDYLLKPIEPERLASALARIRPPGTAAVAAEGNFVRLHWGGASPLVARSLVAFEARLDARKFFRANRAQIVNLDFVERVDLGIGARLHVQLRGGPEVEISRRQARLFQARMGA